MQITIPKQNIARRCSDTQMAMSTTAKMNDTANVPEVRPANYHTSQRHSNSRGPRRHEPHRRQQDVQRQSEQQDMQRQHQQKQRPQRQCQQHDMSKDKT